MISLLTRLKQKLQPQQLQHKLYEKTPVNVYTCTSNGPTLYLFITILKNGKEMTLFLKQHSADSCCQILGSGSFLIYIRIILRLFSIALFIHLVYNESLILIRHNKVKAFVEIGKRFEYDSPSSLELIVSLNGFQDSFTD